MSAHSSDDDKWATPNDFTNCKSKKRVMSAVKESAKKHSLRKSASRKVSRPVAKKARHDSEEKQFSKKSIADYQPSPNAYPGIS